MNFLLGEMENDPAWSNVKHIAYALATTGHETAWSFQPVEEGYYLGTKAKVKAFQKSLRYYPFFGRGYVQLTWETKRIPNYSKASKALGIDFVKNPHLVMVKENAYKILTLGMHEGWFTGKTLSDYIHGTTCDYKKARKIINGLDKAEMIAGYAKQFEEIIKLSAASSAKPATQPVTPLPVVEPTEDANQPPSIPLVPVAQPVIEVNQISAAPDEAKPDDKPDRMLSIGNRLSAVWTAAGASVLAIGAFLTSTPIGIAVSIISAVAVVGGIYMLVNWRRNENKDNRDASEKLERDKWAADLKEQRENRAFVLQKLTLESASNPNLNTVTIKAPPPVEIANSDTKEGNAQ